MKYLLIALSFSISTTMFSQINMKSNAGKRYKKIYKKLDKDPSFLSCRLLTSIANKVTGVELYFKNNISYVVSFRKGVLNNSYNCDSYNIRTARVYVIHKFIDKEYQEGYCKCNADEKVKLIKPTIHTE